MAKAAEKLAASDPFAIAAVSQETQVAAEQFLYRQAEILDEQRWDDWLGLFAKDGHYWMPAEANQTDGEGVPNIFWEDKGCHVDISIILNNSHYGTMFLHWEHSFHLDPFYYFSE